MLNRTYLIDAFIPATSYTANRTRPKPPYQKPDAVKELEKMATDAARIKYPYTPHLAPRMFRDDTANHLTGCIVAYISLKGGFASRINSTGSFRTERGGFVPGCQRKGIADIWGTYRGLSLQVEVKIGKDRQSEAQSKVEADQQRAGGHYFIARNFSEFKNWFDQL